MHTDASSGYHRSYMVSGCIANKSGAPHSGLQNGRIHRWIVGASLSADGKRTLAANLLHEHHRFLVFGSIFGAACGLLLHSEAFNAGKKGAGIVK